MSLRKVEFVVPVKRKKIGNKVNLNRETLVALTDMTPFLTPAEKKRFSIDTRRGTSADKAEFGLFLGYVDSVHFEPEVVVDADGAYVLIFNQKGVD